MKLYPLKILIIASLPLLLLACDDTQTHEDATHETSLGLKQVTLTPKEKTQRWYFSQQAARGKQIFADHCAICHGAGGEGAPNWEAPTKQGVYPPPPLNGSAHAWHHPLSILGATIYGGGAASGGQMPAFKGRLSENEIIDVIAHIQSNWPDNNYQRWLSIEKSSRQQK